MAGKNTAAFGIYSTTAQAEQAVDRLVETGFPQQDISVLLPDTQSSKEFAHEKKNTKAPEGSAVGVTAGGAVGGLVGALIGMGIPEYEAKRYEGRIKDGGVLLSVHCDTSAAIDSAKEILKASGAEDISSAGEKSVSSHHVTDESSAAGAGVGGGSRG